MIFYLTLNGTFRHCFAGDDNNDNDYVLCGDKQWMTISLTYTTNEFIIIEFGLVLECQLSLI